jgi:ribosomal protein L28
MPDINTNGNKEQGRISSQPLLFGVTNEAVNDSSHTQQHKRRRYKPTEEEKRLSLPEQN